MTNSTTIGTFMADHAFLFPHHDDYRFAPNYWLRSALFGALPPGNPRIERATDDPGKIASLENMDLMMRGGPAFDQADLDVLLAIMNEVAIREADGGAPINALSLAIRGLLDATARQDGGKNRKWLCQSLARIGQSQLTFSSRGDASVFTDWASLITVNANSRVADITLNDSVRELYKAGYTGINWTERQQLSPLGKWLHAFYSSHGRAPLRIKIQTIRRLCGRTLKATGMVSTFHKTLEAELQQLAAVTQWQCAIENGKVEIRKPNDGIGGNAESASKYLEHLGSGDWEEDI